EDSPFKDQFKGLAIEPMVEYVKNRKPDKPNQIQAITGATITTKAVVNGLNEGIKRVAGVLKSGG
ncbi:MAG: FMN-binding protein, partial [Deltaproteobacteria bacterium]|nr:FMN-binding protein [Deltaproteobacteria bacterium]